MIVPAGSIVAFDSYVFHRSGPNQTEHMRRIYLPQYSAAPILRPDGKPWALATPFLKDGKNIYDHAGDIPDRYGPFPDQSKDPSKDQIEGSIEGDSAARVSFWRRVSPRLTGAIVGRNGKQDSTEHYGKHDRVDPQRSANIAVLKTRLSYTASEVAGQLIFCVVSFYLLKFYTDVYGISAAAAGSILLLARSIDAIDAPVWGILFDRTRSRWGKSRPWFLRLCVPFALFGV